MTNFADSSALPPAIMAHIVDDKKLARSAVYFPHNNIRSKDFVKHALLFWDRVYTIVPRDTRIHDTSAVPPEAQALGIFRARSPEPQDQYEVYKRLERVCSGPDRGAWLNAAVPNADMFPYPMAYPIYEAKFSEATWQLLKEMGLVDPHDASNEPLTKPATGLWLMAMLADSMAGESLATITDRHAAYAWLEQAVALNRGMQELNPDSLGGDADEYEFAARATLPVIGATQFDMDKLISLRRREAEGETWLTTARHHYLDLLSTYPSRVTEAANSGVRVEEFHAQFNDECRESLRQLQEALQIVKLKVLLNDKVTLPLLLPTVGVLAGTQSVVAALATLGAGTLFAGVKQVLDAREDRRKVLTNNRLAWGYMAAG